MDISNIFRILAIMKKLLLILLLITSCTKPDIEVCGNVTGGGVKFNPAYGFEEYYLLIDNNKEWVDLKTYESFYVGDYVCLY